ncbi:hypothetical protein BKA70DRAFT_1427277 [Coprinopsis sp. MPI-PUGE-AT-0042]|nr:hypothetical protein BKA70DRAFT_1427277 [Coprinopsis sp. MPI-PUGE-AT-0042]
MGPKHSEKVNCSRTISSAFVAHKTKRKVEARLVELSENESPTKHGTKRQRLDLTSCAEELVSSDGQPTYLQEEGLPPAPNFGQQSDRPAVANSNYDYMQQWIPKINSHLEVIYASETHEPSTQCSKCGSGDAIWKCITCFASPLLCTTCCKDEHNAQPFHRIKMWTGRFYENSWLWKVGVAIYTGHGGKCCPRATPIATPSLSAEEFQKTAKSHRENHYDFSYGASSQLGTQDQCFEAVIVHVNGVHHLPLVPCQCLSSDSEETAEPDRKGASGDSAVLHLLRLGLFPSSFKAATTMFTFEVLDDFLLQTLECNTSGLHYHSKLQRMTNHDFPHTVPDRYRELLRVSRQYDFLQLMVRFLYFQREQAMEEGSLALFCAACPQPGKNLPPDWQDDPEIWKYFMSFVVDGNFVCAHLKSKGAGQDVFLKMGQGYFAGINRYRAHVNCGTEEDAVRLKGNAPNRQDGKSKSRCNEFRAVTDKNKFHKGYDSTGIAAFACARHGCIVPASVVDFQKGERQLNIDYGLCQTVRMVVAPQIRRLFLLYDIACHYCVNLLERVENGEYLELPKLLEILFGIGQFHVHGHQEKCFVGFSPMFIPGIGTVAGEILESDWSIINPVGLLCIAMTVARRIEVLDAKMLDLNWKKMTNLAESLVKLFLKAKSELCNAEEALGLLSSTVAKVDRAGWEKELAHAQAARAQGNIATMDILQPAISKAPSRKDVQATLMEGEDQRMTGLGISCWVAEGIALQEAQIALMTLAANCQKSPTEVKELELQKRRQAVLRRITDHVAQAATLFPHLTDTATAFVKAPIREPCRCEEWETCGHLGLDINPFSQVPGTEDQRLEVPLPSCALAPTVFDPDTRRKELCLRVAQANEALEGLRQEIGLKTFLFKANKRLASTKSERIRGFAGISAANREIDRYVRVYNQARWAMRRLSKDPELIARFQPLEKRDLAPLKTVYSANSPGATTATISWIWSVRTGAASPLDSAYMAEIARLNYLRLLCRRDRWREEFSLVSSEMQWTILFFENSAKTDINRNVQNGPPGFAEAVARRANLWDAMALQARAAFEPYIHLS